MKIWTLATDNLTLDEDYLCFFFYLYPDPTYGARLGACLGIQPNAFNFEVSESSGNVGHVCVAKMRENLLATCRTSRLMTLEV